MQPQASPPCRVPRKHGGCWSTRRSSRYRTYDAGPVIDVGSGGGSPGLPLAASLPGLRFDLLESSGRKCAFLSAAASDFPNVEVICARAEEHARVGGRDAYAVVLARALAPQAVAAEWCLPLVRARRHADPVRVAASRRASTASRRRSARRRRRSSRTPPDRGGRCSCSRSLARRPSGSRGGPGSRGNGRSRSLAGVGRGRH